MTEQEKEKVLHGIDSCGFCDGVPNICEVTECPYRGNKGWCVHELAHDAGMLISELMEEQEPIAPVKVNRYMETDENGNWFSSETYDCGDCGVELHGKANYCHLCGRAVKWE